MTLPNGSIVNQRYEILSVLGQGGFGITYLAEDLELKRRVALKELFITGNSQRAEDQTVISVALEGIPFQNFVERFLREAQQIAQFNHTNIVRVFEFFEANGTAYFAMEHISGMTLQELISVNGPLEGKQAIEVVNSLISAVNELHGQGVIHRDIKPANVMISDAWRVVLIDFGTARSFDNGRTVSTVAMVSSGYSPWEQYGENGKLTEQSDIYAIGATMYYLLTGKKPLAAPDRMGGEMKTPAEVNLRVSSTISGSVMKALALMPQDRYHSISDLKIAFERTSHPEKPETGGGEDNYKTEFGINAFGRIDRLTYFYRCFLATLLSALPVGLFIAAKEEHQREESLIEITGSIALLSVVIYITFVCFQLSKRLQDCGTHGAWALVGLVPFAGQIFAGVMLIVPGHAEPNKYGKPPLYK